jgi:hypothetical protein
VGRLQRLQFLEQPVVLGVGYRRRVEHVVAARVLLDLLAQGVDTRAGVGCFHAVGRG